MKPMITTTPVIEVRNLVRRYGRTEAVNQILWSLITSAEFRFIY